MKFRLITAVGLLAAATFAPLASNAQTEVESQPVSLTTTGEMGNQSSGYPSLSGDGRFIAFRSEADNLVEGDTNGVADIFVQDRLSQTTGRVSIASNGEQSDMPAEQPQISANGRVVVFRSRAQTLVPAQPTDTGIFYQIYVHDRLTGLTEQISVNNYGERGNADAANPSISANGRYVAFTSTADNLVRDDTNNAADVFIHDRLTGYTQRASVGTRGQEGNAASGAQLALAADGHTVVFASQASSLATSFDGGMQLFYYNRVMAETSYLNFPADGRQRELLQLISSKDAVTFVGLAQLDPERREILVFKPYNDAAQSLTTLPDTGATGPQIALSGDGRILVAPRRGPDGTTKLQRFDLENDSVTTLAPAEVESVAISQDGETIAYTQKDGDGRAQVYLLTGSDPGFTISGRVTGPLGDPLGFVSITNSTGEVVITDEHGYFFFGGSPPGVTLLKPAKDGYTIEPGARVINIDATLASLQFNAYPQQILAEAAQDLGMPYAAERGESGPFHGYAAGYCTDLVLDAYTWGADFNIQAALEQDYRARPAHFYGWRDARDAHDMWRYFSYAGQIRTHEQPYQPGDIVFFDWDEDGEIDHVSLVSAVDDDQRPFQLYDATGVIDSNPDGLADELRWVDFHERTVRGHARWSGLYESMVPELPGGTYFQAAVASAQAELRLVDPQGNPLSQSERATPGGYFFDLGWEQSLSVPAPLGLGENYRVEIHNPTAESATFSLMAHTIQDGLVIKRVAHKATLEPDETLTVLITLALNDAGELNLSAPLIER